MSSAAWQLARPGAQVSGSVQCRVAARAAWGTTGLSIAAWQLAQPGAQVSGSVRCRVAARAACGTSKRVCRLCVAALAVLLRTRLPCQHLISTPPLGGCTDCAAARSSTRPPCHVALPVRSMSIPAAESKQKLPEVNAEEATVGAEQLAPPSAPMPEPTPQSAPMRAPAPLSALMCALAPNTPRALHVH
eukprot:365104-Chlamydomonas_euryale.AAC.11